VRIIARGVDNPPTNFGVLPLSTHSAVEMLHDSALYKFMIDIDIDIHSRLIGQHLSDASRDLVTLILEVTALIADAGLRIPSVCEV